MISRPSRFLRLLLILSTTAALLAAPLPVAAQGNPRGTQATFTVTALTSAVSVGQSAAFEAFIRNDGSATFTHVRIVAEGPGATLVSAPDGCSGSGASVSCSLGKLASGQSMTLLLVFGAPGAAGEIELQATLQIDSGSDNRQASSKDTFHAAAEVAVIDSPDFFGSWQPAHGGNVSFSTDGIGGGNRQSTSVTVPPVGFGYPALLAEQDENIVCHGKVYKGFGDAVEMSIANGAELSPHLTLTLVYDKHAAADRNPWNVRFVHQTDDGTCQFPPRGCNEHNDGFCFDAWWSGHGWNRQLVLRVELPSNGRGKGL
jgi:hypothetical protein